MGLQVLDEHPEGSCLLTDGGNGRQRHYWEHMAEAGIRKESFAGVKGCPFAGPLYQLMRQQLLAAYITKAGEADQADVLVLGFGDNASLGDVPSALQCMRANQGDRIIGVWNRALAGGNGP